MGMKPVVPLPKVYQTRLFADGQVHILAPSLAIMRVDELLILLRRAASIERKDKR
jgi:hypothetical protein